MVKFPVCVLGLTEEPEAWVLKGLERWEEVALKAAFDIRVVTPLELDVADVEFACMCDGWVRDRI